MPASLTNGILTGYDLIRFGASSTFGAKRRLLNAAAWSNTWPAPAATLDLDFVNNRSFVEGNGQSSVMDTLTFTRASNANWVDQNGVLRSSAGTFTGTANANGKNLYTAPQDFNDASWGKTNAATITNIETAPDGTNTASKLVCIGAASNRKFMFQSSALNRTVSMYAKASDWNWFSIGKTNSGGYYSNVNFNLNTGAMTTYTIGGSELPTSYTMTDVGNGWWRCVVVWGAATFGSTLFFAATPDGDPVWGSAYSTAGDGTRGVLIWGAQLENGSTLTDYYPTNLNLPRFDWSSTNQLLQPNRFPYSSDPNTFITSVSSVTKSTFVGGALDGTNALYLTEDTSTNFRSVLGTNGVPPSGNIFTVSAYVKANGRSRVAIGFYERPNVYGLSLFNITGSGTYVNSTAPNSTFRGQSITALSDGWYRISSTWSHTASGNASLWLYFGDSTLQVTYPMSTGSYTGDGTSGIIFYGPQLELGSSVSDFYGQGSTPITSNIPLAAASTCNGLVIEEGRTNNALWCRDPSAVTSGFNMLVYSEQLNNGNWAITNGVSITADAATAPDSTVSAEKITATAIADPYRGQAVNMGGNFFGTVTGSVWLWTDAGQPTTAQLLLFKGGASNGGTTAQAISKTITLTSTPTRYTITHTFTNANSTLTYLCFRIDLAQTGDPDPVVNEYLYAWGAQLETGDTASTYTKTVASQAYGWKQSNVTVVKDQAGVDNASNTACSITATSNNGYVYTQTFLAGTYTISLFVKRLSGTGPVKITTDGSTWSTINLPSNQWTRVIITGSISFTSIGVLLASSGDSVSIDYAQIEAGSYVTSPIFTTSATATRSAEDVSLKNPFNALFLNKDEGTLYWFGIAYPNSTTGGGVWVGDGTYYRLMKAFIGSSNQVGFFYHPDSFVYPGGSAVGILTPSFGSTNKVAGTYTPTRLASSLNGSIPLTNQKNAYTPFPSTQWYMNFGSSDTAGPSSQKVVKRILFLPYSISDTALQELTT